MAALALSAVVALVSILGVGRAAADPAATTTTLISGDASVTQGDAVTFTARVTGASPPTGTITFTEGASTLGTGTLVGDASNSLAAGYGFTCAVDTAGAVSCWGSNNVYQQGTGDQATHAVPTAVSGLSGRYVQVVTGVYHACALGETGGVACWGYDTVFLRKTATAISGLPAGIRALASSSSASTTCALAGDGSVWCWGYNGFGQVVPAGATQVVTPTAIADLGGEAVQVVVGGVQICALLTTGSVRCQGGNGYGSLGDGNTFNAFGPVTVTGLPSDIVSIAAGKQHGCALTSGGAVWCWGDNRSGQLGIGTTVSKSTAVAVSGLPADIRAITAGADQTCAVSTAQGAYCWGANVDGQIGNGTTAATQTTPVATSALGSTTIGIALGQYHTCAVLPAATQNVECLGYGPNGEMGNSMLGATDPITTAQIVANSYTALLQSVATWTTSTLTVGHHGVVAGYSGDAGSAASQSSTYVQTVVAATTTGLSADFTTRAYGQTVTLTATPSDAAATGTVAFFDGTGQIGSATLSSGTASFATNALTIGDHSLTAVYGGDGAFAGSTSSAVVVTVTMVDTTTSLASSADPSIPGQTVKFTAFVSDTGATGDVSFFDDTTLLGTGTLSAGTATWSTSTLTLGDHPITAVYSGDTTFVGSTSSVLTQTVAKSVSQVALAADVANPVFGQPVTFTATVTPSSATGSVTFGRGATTLGTGTLTGGVATLTVSNLPIGASSVTAAYAGDAVASSGSTSLSVTVANASTATTLTTTSPTVLPGTTVTLAATVAAVAPGSGTPTGNVVFKNGATTLATVALASGKAQVTTTLSTSGTAAFTAAYAGKSGYAASLGSTSVVVDGRDGAPILVDTTTAGSQQQSAVAVLKNGQPVVVWASQVAGGSTFRVFGQRYTAAHVATGTAEFAVAATASDQPAPAVAALGGGGFVVVWRAVDAGVSHIVMQRFSATGAKVGGETRVDQTASADRSAPAVAPLAGGGHVVVWQSKPTTANALPGIAARVYSAAGAATTAEFRADTTVSTGQTAPVVAGLADGRFVVAWTSTTAAGASKGIRGQVFKAAGTKSGGEFALSTTTAATQTQPSIAATADGGFVAAWTSQGQTGRVSSIYAQRFSSTVAKSGGETRLHTDVATDKAAPTLAAFPGGGFTAAWTDKTDATHQTIVVGRYRAGVTAADALQPVTVKAATLLSQPALAVASDAAYVLTLTAAAPLKKAEEVYAQPFALVLPK